eukprot:CAMPEP_0185592384 /NCGR_PEP_ID=MMETSP0434-20130131/67791_1 /TAXON_ID=626734 ORGANISM="Favella taraikaensis, Strain Fe Narragansett Bay" /NCGR_SAMPLE_ID=MMETSP0434 /ASSEMBLY_ACC=CAM_ASM_000379 /LENGTH=44 /DNA_ID= /DNA_START= /DNA_END= /DNA_ORIENTATION=
MANNIQRGTFDPIKGALIAKSTNQPYGGHKLRDLTPQATRMAKD